MSRQTRVPGLASGRELLTNVAQFFVAEATTLVGNTLGATIDTAQRYGYFAWQNAAANGDSWSIPFYLDEGLYTISVLGVTANSRGIQDVYIDGVVVGTLDWYAGSLTYNVTKTIASVTISRGRHVFKSVVNGKNASSSNYQMLLTKVWIQ